VCVCSSSLVAQRLSPSLRSSSMHYVMPRVHSLSLSLSCYSLEHTLSRIAATVRIVEHHRPATMPPPPTTRPLLPPRDYRTSIKYSNTPLLAN
jgi:hypothetical protein